MGNGILVAGGRQNNLIERNLVYDHERIGIGLVPFPEEDANDKVPTVGDELDRSLLGGRRTTRRPTRKSAGTVIWPAADNTVIGNDVERLGPRRPRLRRPVRRAPPTLGGQLLQRQHLRHLGTGGHRDA